MKNILIAFMILCILGLTASVIVLQKELTADNALNVETMSQMVKDMAKVQQEIQHQQDTQSDFLIQGNQLINLIDTVQEGVHNEDVLSRMNQ